MVQSTREGNLLARFDRFFAVGLWLVVALSLLIWAHGSIATLLFLDPDDALRLVQVRDLLGGQDWYDSTQYRMAPPAGADIHWSRFIDAQLAGLILLLQPIVGAVWAERLAVALYPLLLLLPIFLLLERLLAQFGSRSFVRLGLLIAATSTLGLSLGYFKPLRIDHHGWQILLALLVLVSAFGADSWKRGLVAAFALAVHLEISLEGLPFLAIFFALFALDWVADARCYRRLGGFAIGLAVFPLAWRLLWRGGADSFSTHCDAFTLPYWLPTMLIGGAVAALIFAGRAQGEGEGERARMVQLLQQRRAYRFGALVAVAVLGAAAFVAVGSACLGGPFSDMDPFVRDNWYNKIVEGTAVVYLRGLNIIVLTVPSTIGVAVALCAAWREHKHCAESAQLWTQSPWAQPWGRLCFVTLCAAVAALFISRMNASVQLFLVPAYVQAVRAIWHWARAQQALLARVFASASALLPVPLASAYMVGLLAYPFLDIDKPDSSKENEENTAFQKACVTEAHTAALARQSPALLFAPLGLGPHLLLHTPHSVVGGNYHRNQDSIKQVLVTFRASPEQAEPLIRRTAASYVVWCPHLGETAQAKRDAPDGLAARLEAKQSIAWLRFEPQLSSGTLRVYRVLPSDSPAPLLDVGARPSRDS